MYDLYTFSWKTLLQNCSSSSKLVLGKIVASTGAKHYCTLWEHICIYNQRMYWYFWQQCVCPWLGSGNIVWITCQFQTLKQIRYVFNRCLLPPNKERRWYTPVFLRNVKIRWPSGRDSSLRVELKAHAQQVFCLTTRIEHNNRF